jgi:hypothetical protein
MNATAERLTMDEIEQRYDGEWVLIEEPEVAEDGWVESGVVTAHSRDADVVDRAARERRPPDAAFFWIGAPPDDVIYLMTPFPVTSH